jgi:6-phosphogluconolactonase (cycloisomerase 2 family)
MGQIRFFARGIVCIALVGLFASRASAGQVGFVYALQQVNGAPNQIHGFRIDETTGALTALPGFPMSSGGNGTSGSVAEQLAYFNGKLFVVNDGSNTLTVFSVNAVTGALTAMPFSPVALGAGGWNCVTVHPTGSPVVVGDGNDNELASFVVTEISAAAALGSPFSTGASSPFSCRFAHAGTQVYSGGNVEDNFIAGFSVNSGTGVLTPLAGSPFNSGMSRPIGFASDSSRLFTTAIAVDEVRVFTTAGGVLTAVAGNPFASGLDGAVQGILHPGGFYMVADRFGGAVGVYQISGADAATTVAAVAGSPFLTGGTFTAALTLTPDGTHLVAANGTSRNLSVFTVDPASGVLSGVSTQAANTLGASGNITGLVFAPGEAGFVYSLRQVNGGANQIYGYRINPGSGALTALGGFPVATGGTGTTGSFAEQMAYRNGRLYVLNDGSDTLSAFKVNRTTGALTALPFSPLAVPAGSQGCVAVHPSGSPVVVGDGSTRISSINIGATTAVFAPGSPFESSPSYSCAFSQDGNYVYTGGNFGSTISGYSVNAATGVLTPLAGSPFESGNNFPGAYATDSGGRLFTATIAPAALRAFTTAAGIPTAVSGNPFPATGIDGQVRGILHPGGFYLTAGRSSGNVGVFQIAGAGAATTLTAVAGSPIATGGVGTSGLALTTNGAYLAVANGSTRNLTVFQVNPATGRLASVGVQAANTLGMDGLLTGLAFVAAVPPFIDDPLTALPALSRVIKAAHITELRSRVDSVRAQYGLAPYAYTGPVLTPGVTVIQAAHIIDLRAALAEVYAAAGSAAPIYTDPALGSGTIVVKAVHIMELRAVVINIE